MLLRKAQLLTGGSGDWATCGWGAGHPALGRGATSPRGLLPPPSPLPGPRPAGSRPKAPLPPSPSGSRSPFGTRWQPLWWELNPSLISSSRHRPTREGSGLGVFLAPPHAQESAWFLTRVGEQISAPSPLLASLWPTPPHGQARSAWERALAREAVGTIT